MISFRQADLLPRLKTQKFTAEIWDRHKSNGPSDEIELYCHRMRVDSAGSEDLMKFASIVIGNTLVHCNYQKPWGQKTEFNFFKSVRASQDALQSEQEYISSYIAEHGHATLGNGMESSFECELAGEGSMQHINLRLTLREK